MGNLAFMSFNRAVSDDKFTDMLTSVVEENYGDYYEVEVSPNDTDDGTCWVIQPKLGILEPKLEERCRWSFSLFIWRATDFRKSDPETGRWAKSKGKFEHKHMRAGHWGYWFMDQIHGHMSAKYGSRSSDEGVEGTWKIDPTECPTAADKMRKNYRCYREKPELLEAILGETPAKLLEIRD